MAYIIFITLLCCLTTIIAEIDCEFDVCGSRHCPPKGFDIGVETVKHGDVNANV